MRYEFTDRYKALGIPYPDPKTMCDGQCEGTGFIPIYGDSGAAITNEKEPLNSLWKEAHRKCTLSLQKRIGRFFRDWRKVIQYGFAAHWKVCFGKCDGWHFVKCPDCNGTGKK